MYSLNVDNYFRKLVHEHPYLLDYDCLPVTRSESKQAMGDIDPSEMVGDIKDRYYHILKKDWQLYETALLKAMLKKG